MLIDSVNYINRTKKAGESAFPSNRDRSSISVPMSSSRMSIPLLHAASRTISLVVAIWMTVNYSDANLIYLFNVESIMQTEETWRL